MKSDQYIVEIEHTREAIDKTLLMLEGKLSPRELWEQALTWSGGAREFSLNLGRTIRDNPIPATLLGISLIWLLVAGTSTPQTRLSTQERLDRAERERLNREMANIDPRLIM